MPKKPKYFDKLAIDLMNRSAERCPHSSSLQLGVAMQDGNEMDISIKELSTSPWVTEEDLSGSRKRWESISLIAKYQAYTLLNVGHSLLKKNGFESVQIEEALINSLAFGRKFARIGGPTPSRSDSQDMIFLRQVVASPEEFVEISDSLRLIFSDKASELMEPYIGKGIGCSVLAETVESPEKGRINMFDAHWEALAEQYVEEYVQQDRAFEPPTYH